MVFDARLSRGALAFTVILPFGRRIVRQLTISVN